MRGVFGSKPLVYNGFVKMRNTQFESVLTACNGHIYGLGERFRVVNPQNHAVVAVVSQVDLQHLFFATPRNIGPIAFSNVGAGDK